MANRVNWSNGADYHLSLRDEYTANQALLRVAANPDRTIRAMRPYLRGGDYAANPKFRLDAINTLESLRLRLRQNGEWEAADQLSRLISEIE